MRFVSICQLLKKHFCRIGVWSSLDVFFSGWPFRAFIVRVPCSKMSLQPLCIVVKSICNGCDTPFVVIPACVNLINCCQVPLDMCLFPVTEGKLILTVYMVHCPYIALSSTKFTRKFHDDWRHYQPIKFDCATVVTGRFQINVKTFVQCL